MKIVYSNFDQEMVNKVVSCLNENGIETEVKSNNLDQHVHTKSFEPTNYSVFVDDSNEDNSLKLLKEKDFLE